jgi:16S rRNA (uracil1498-N3)-methyltransferase
LAEPALPVRPEYAPIATRAAAAAQVFVDDPSAPALGADDRHHLEKVLRLRAGEEVIVSDGAGRWGRTLWVDGKTPLTPVQGASGPGGDGSVQFEAAPAPTLTVAFAPTKGERPEWVVQKLTELGVDRVVPLISARSVIRWEGERGASAVERLRRVGREAASQCRRVWLPEVTEVMQFSQLGRLGPAGQVVLAQLSGAPPAPAHLVVAVGPEGGWNDEELDSGLPTVGFGLSVLRAETAAVTAGALMVSLRTGTVAPVGATS